MLVLSRRSKDKIHFPQVGITIHFIRVRSGQAKVGIDAPRDIAIMRDEVDADGAAAEFVRRKLLRLPRKIRHDIRSELHRIRIDVDQYKQQLAGGLENEAQETFKSLTDAIARLDTYQALQGPDGKPSKSIDKVSIVLIEQNANEREMLAGLLRLHGYHVHSFCNGDEAMLHFEDAVAPEIVLVDVSMSSMNGIDNVNALRASERFHDTFIFAIGDTSPQDIERQVGHNCIDRWFRKPLNPEFLVDAIDQTIGGPSSISSPVSQNNHVPRCTSGT